MDWTAPRAQQPSSTSNMMVTLSQDHVTVQAGHDFQIALAITTNASFEPSIVTLGESEMIDENEEPVAAAVHWKSGRWQNCGPAITIDYPQGPSETNYHFVCILMPEDVPPGDYFKSLSVTNQGVTTWHPFTVTVVP